MLYHHSENVASPSMVSTFSLFFPRPKGQWPPVEGACDDHSTVTTSPSSPSSSSTVSVDCTLSLGTPSSRRADPERKHGPPAYPSVASLVSWDPAAESYYRQQGKPTTAGAAKDAVGSVGHDPLLDRRCANCGTTSTPLWRNGPRGPKSLCNACGIRFKKEERRAAAMTESGGTACAYSAQRAQGPAPKAAPRAVSYAEEALPCGDVDAEVPFLAWRHIVVPPAPAAAATVFSVWHERASLFQHN